MTKTNPGADDVHAASGAAESEFDMAEQSSAPNGAFEQYDDSQFAMPDPGGAGVATVPWAGSLD